MGAPLGDSAGEVNGDGSRRAASLSDGGAAAVGACPGDAGGDLEARCGWVGVSDHQSTITASIKAPPEPPSKHQSTIRSEHHHTHRCCVRCHARGRRHPRTAEPPTAVPLVQHFERARAEPRRALVMVILCVKLRLRV
jgi:hypothetical protein